MIFCTNLKRYENINLYNGQELTVTSNILKSETVSEGYVVSYNDLVSHNDTYCDDSVLMLINLLNFIGINKFALAGFDGYKKNEQNYYDVFFERRENDMGNFGIIKHTLEKYCSNMEITFVTPSVYEIEK
jgi:4-hydroxy 2-oxovalerate aldolase